MTLQYKNTAINYQIQGRGPALVLVHGFLESSKMWDALIPELTATHRVVTIDLPGHGLSGNIGQVHTMELMAAIVQHVLDAHKIKSAITVGHSMGGYVLLALAQSDPDYIDKLVLLNSSPFADNLERLKNRRQGLKLLKTIPDRFISMAITNLFAVKNQERLYAQINALKQEALAMNLEGITAAIRGMMQRPDRSLVLKQFGANAAIIASKEDPLIPITNIRQLAVKNGNQFIALPGGHMSTYEHPKLTLKAIQELC